MGDKNLEWIEVDAENVAKEKIIGSPIGVIPAGGNGGRDKFSKLSIQWLEWKSQKRGVQIQLALNGGEVKILKPGGGYYKADGYYVDPQSGKETVLEFQGCFHNSCPMCYSGELVHPHFNQPLKEKSARQTRKRLNLLQRVTIMFLYERMSSGKS